LIGETPTSALSPMSLKKDNIGFEDLVVTKKETPRNMAQERIEVIQKKNTSDLKVNEFSTFKQKKSSN
jgi:hypothetical protein